MMPGPLQPIPPGLGATTMPGPLQWKARNNCGLACLDPGTKGPHLMRSPAPAAACEAGLTRACVCVGTGVRLVPGGLQSEQVCGGHWLRDAAV